MTHTEAVAKAVAARLILPPPPQCPPCRICGRPGDGHIDKSGAMCAECTIIELVRGALQIEVNRGL